MSGYPPPLAASKPVTDLDSLLCVGFGNAYIFVVRLTEGKIRYISRIASNNTETCDCFGLVDYFLCLFK